MATASVKPWWASRDTRNSVDNRAFFLYRAGTQAQGVLSLYPGMPWIVSPGAVGPAFSGQNPRIIQRISGAGHHGMVAAGNQDRIPMLNGIRMIERLWVGGVSVDAHEAEALFRFDLEII